MKRVKINYETIFYFSYILALFSWMFSNVKYIMDICDIILKISYCTLTLAYVFKFKQLSKKEKLISVFTLVTAFISWRIANNPTLYILFIFILSAKDIDLKKFINNDYKIKIVLLCTIILLYYLGCTENFIMYRSSGIVRSSMGFSHPNIFGAYIFSIFSEYLYINHKKVKTPLLIIASIIIAFLIFYFSDSRGSYLSIIFLCAMIILYRFNPRDIFDNKIFKKAIIYSSIIFAIASIILAIRYVPTSNLYLKIDSLLSGRIKFAHWYLDTYNIKLLGNKLLLVSTYLAVDTGQRAYVLDNAYIKIILQYGIIIFLLFFIPYIKACKRAYEKKDYILVIMFFIYAVRGLTENILFGLYGNVFLLFVGIELLQLEVDKITFMKIKNLALYYIDFYKYTFYKKVIIYKQNRLCHHIDLQIDKKSIVVIHEGLKTEKNVSIKCRENAKLGIGKNVFFNNNCVITCRNKIVIDDDVIVGPNVIVFDHDHDYKSENRKSSYVCKEIHIGKNVWIGANACILKGSNIGDNTVIAAGVIVNGDIPDNCIYFGNGKIKKIGD